MNYENASRIPLFIIVSILIPIVTNIATSILPESWEPYFGLAWPILLILMGSSIRLMKRPTTRRRAHRNYPNSTEKASNVREHQNYTSDSENFPSESSNLNKSYKSSTVLGILLMLMGVWMLVTHSIPALNHFVELYTWPSNLLGVGFLIFLIGLLTSTPGLAIPAFIMVGSGGILHYQEVNGDYSSWSYMWTLIPCFVGVGHIIEGFFR